MEFIDGGLRQIKATGDIHGFEPALFAPAPEGAGGHAQFFAPRIQTDDRARVILGCHNDLIIIIRMQPSTKYLISIIRVL
jgi:hypothetical protein